MRSRQAITHPHHEGHALGNCFSKTKAHLLEEGRERERGKKKDFQKHGLLI